MDFRKIVVILLKNYMVLKKTEQVSFVSIFNIVQFILYSLHNNSITL